jgi:hypothetical protein
LDLITKDSVKIGVGEYTNVVTVELIATSADMAAKRARWTLIHARTYGDIDEVQWLAVGVVECRWFAGCSNDAVSFVDHPAIPDGVPTCERCKARATA